MSLVRSEQRCTFVLASQSPRRRDLLASAGLDFSVSPANVDEVPKPGEWPYGYAIRVAREKAEVVFGQRRHEHVLAADTVVALDGDILGKAATDEEAHQMLSRLSGRAHSVHTAVALLSPDRAGPWSTIVTTQVRFRDLTEREIAAYVKTGESMDKAGAYGIQGSGGALVLDVRGSYTNVVGLPLEETLRLLRLAGVLQWT